MEIMLGATRMRQAQTKIRKRVMNGMVYLRMKMDKKNRIHGRVVIQTNGTNIVKIPAIIVHLHQNRKFTRFKKLANTRFTLFIYLSH